MCVPACFQAFPLDSALSLHFRLSGVQHEHSDIRNMLAQRDEQIRILRTSESILQEQLIGKEGQISRLQAENARLCNEATNARNYSSTIESTMTTKLKSHKVG
jgi:hypothetical protein